MARWLALALEAWQRTRTALSVGWQRLSMDERTAYLSQANSHADLETRMRAWDDHDRDSVNPFW